MNFAEYSDRARRTALYPGVGKGNIIYPALKLAGEAGEVAEKIGKHLRGDADNRSFFSRPLGDDGPGSVGFDWLTTEAESDLLLELGDVLWYVDALARELGEDLETIARMNIFKLEDRAKRQKLTGTGDNR